VPFTVCHVCEVQINVENKINVKSSGQECPHHTGNFNVKGTRCGRSGSHFSQSTREMGHPRLTGAGEVKVNVNVNVKIGGQECPHHTGGVRDILISTGVGCSVVTLCRKGNGVRYSWWLTVLV
jgi:hypothetical protein